MAGVWSGVHTLESSTGCGCVSDVFRSNIGNTLTVTDEIFQNGTSINGRTTDNSNGAWCDFTGLVGSSYFSMNFTRCSGIFLPIQCANGNLRWLVQFAGGREGNVTGSTATGTQTTKYNCFSAKNLDPIGVLTWRAGFKANKG